MEKKDSSIIRQSLFFFSATMLLNLSGFFYHFFMGRVLGPVDYGILGAVLSLYYLLAVCLNVIQTSITKFVASFQAHHSSDKIGYLFYRGVRRLGMYGALAFLFFSILSIPLSSFLRVPYLSLFLLGLSIPFLFLLPLSRGVLQGLQRFTSLGYNLILEGMFKLLLGISLVYLGLHISGAILGIVFSTLFAFLFSFISLRGISSSQIVDYHRREIYFYALPVALTLFSLTAFYSLDIVLIKHYLSDLDAGLYVAAALLGKIAFFASLAIPLIMFPKVAELQVQHKSTLHILKKSLFFVSLISLGVLITYLLFPQLVIFVLFGGGTYYSISSLLWVFALVFGFYSLAYTLAMYHLSLHRISYLFILGLFNLVQVFALFFFHQSLAEVSFVMLIVMFLLFLLLLIYTLVNHRGT